MFTMTKRVGIFGREVSVQLKTEFELLQSITSNRGFGVKGNDNAGTEFGDQIARNYRIGLITEDLVLKLRKLDLFIKPGDLQSSIAADDAGFGLVQNETGVQEAPLSDEALMQMQKDREEGLTMIIGDMLTKANFEKSSFFQFADINVIESAIDGGQDEQLTAIVVAFVDQILDIDDSREEFLNALKIEIGIHDFNPSPDLIRTPMILAYKEAIVSSVKSQKKPSKKSASPKKSAHKKASEGGSDV